MTGPLRLDAGTSGVPALAFSAETTTGLYRAGTNDVRFAVATVDVLQLTASGVTLPLGTANGVLYLNGSKVATSGSALTFDGTNVGVGTASPGVRLDVSGADGVRARVVATSAGTSGLLLSSAGVTAYALKAGNGDGSFRIDQDGTDRLTLASGGNLGLGTASPTTKLHVNTSAAGYGITVAASSQTSNTYQFGIDGSSNFAIYDTNAAAQRLIISPSGNIYGTAGTTSMTNGFFYIPGAAGIPSGTPTAVANRFPAYVDTTNNRLYIHNGTSWRYASLV
jgi:hypothetical protein